MKWKIGINRNGPPSQIWRKGDPPERAKCLKIARYGFFEILCYLAYLSKQSMSGFFVSKRKGFVNYKLRIMNFEL
jgi:hypothetical protein